MFRLAACLLPILAVAALAADPPPLSNGSFEEWTAPDAPVDWTIPAVCREAGYAVAMADDDPPAGALYARLAGAGGSGDVFGNLMRSVDAAPFRGRLPGPLDGHAGAQT